MRALSIRLLVAALAFGCGDQGLVAHDAGRPTDAEAPDAGSHDAGDVDGGGASDGGPATDAGVPRDAGGTTDAGDRPDAGTMDAGAADAGGGLDAGDEEDAGVDVGSDAGLDSGIDAGPPCGGCAAGLVCTPSGRCAHEVSNPLLPADKPDPHVLRTTQADGSPRYYLMHTVHNGGDLPIYTSTDLVNWSLATSGAFGRTRASGGGLDLNGNRYCSVWAPDLVEVSSAPPVYMLGISAARSAAWTSCPGYGEDGGVYVSSASSPTGPFAAVSRPWEPLRAGPSLDDARCPPAQRANLTRSVDTASQNCQGGACLDIVRLDSNAFRDPADGRWWMGYSWYTNIPAMVSWENGNYGEHVGIVPLDPSDPFVVPCTASSEAIFVANPHDAAMGAALASSCPRCGENLSFTRNRFGDEFVREGNTFGVVEGVGLFRRGGWVYAMLSGSVWDSAYYHVFWIAAPSVEELAIGSATRIVGRYLIPSANQSFGHGAPVLGPDGEHWYYVHHRLDNAACAASDACARDVWISPMEFEDRGDGRGDVWLRARFPVEEPTTFIYVD